MDWNSVENILPDQKEPVLVLIAADDEDYQHFNHMQVAFLSAKQWIGKDSGLKQVTHWLPLPPLPTPPRDEHLEAIKFASDSVMSNYVPVNAGAQHFSFNITVEGKSYTATYHKDVEGFWSFASYQ